MRISVLACQIWAIATQALPETTYAQAQGAADRGNETVQTPPPSALDSGLPQAAVATPGEPFAFGDFTWMNGSNRQSKALLEMPYVTLSALVDINYSFSFNRPVDDTIVGSTVTGRHNEINVLVGSLGADLHYKKVRGSLSTQFGNYATLVPPNDPSTNRGQYNLQEAFKYIREAYAGYHFDVLSGLNVDAGIFMSYIGLFSYLNFENWGYQPSYVSDNTPFFFQGLRLQLFPSDRIKVEFWVVNGWQSYARYNQAPGLGFQFNWRPVEAMSIVTNGYAGYDTPHEDGRLRLHSDSSFLLRYYQNTGNAWVNRAAFSVTADIGGEHGDGVTFTGRPGAPAQYFVGAMAYHRIWFAQDLFALTVGGGFINNPGRYLVLSPNPGVANNPGSANVFQFEAGKPFTGWDASATFDWMPSDYITFRLEVVTRGTNVAYFAGRGGVTSPDGWYDTPTAGFTPNLVKNETRLIGAMMVRL